MRLRKQVFIVLGLVAGGGLAVASFAGSGSQAGAPRLTEELGLSSEQRNQVEALQVDAARGMIRRRADVQVARLDLRQLVTAKAVDEKAIATKLKELSELEAAMLRERVDHTLALRRVLTPDQVEKFRSLRPMGHRGGPARGMRGEGGETPGRGQRAEGGAHQPWADEASPRARR